MYVEDKYDLELDQFFDEHSPFAYQDITARMVETIRKRYWDADQATQERLLAEYVESVNAHGVGCSEHTCGNPRFLQYVLEAGADANIPVPLLEAFKQAMEQAIGADIATAARAAEEFVRRNETMPPAYTENIEGLRMNETESAQELPTSAARPNGELDVLWVGLPLIGLLIAWRVRRRKVRLIGRPLMQPPGSRN